MFFFFGKVETGYIQRFFSFFFFPLRETGKFSLPSSYSRRSRVPFPFLELYRQCSEPFFPRINLHLFVFSSHSSLGNKTFSLPYLPMTASFAVIKYILSDTSRNIFPSPSPPSPFPRLLDGAFFFPSPFLLLLLEG